MSVNLGEAKRLVLAIDDSAVLLATIKRALEFGGFEVLTASDPVEGVRLYKQRDNEIALVLIDYEMPVLRGDEVLEQLRCSRPDVRALLISSCDADIAKSVLEKGFWGFIQKPITREVLLNRVHDAINSASPITDGTAPWSGVVRQGDP